MKTKNIGKSKLIALFFFGFLMMATIAFSQTTKTGKPSIAVIEFGTGNKASFGAAQEITALMIDELVNSGRFTVVDRSKTSAIGDEIVAALQGSIDPNTAAQIGKKIGAQFLVLGTVIEFGEKKKGGLIVVNSYEAAVKFNLRVVNSTTGEIILSQSFEKKADSFGLQKNTVAGDFKSEKLQEVGKKSTQEAVKTLINKLAALPLSPNPSATETTSNQNADCSKLIGKKAPKIMVIIPEIHITQKIPDPAGETEIIKKLVEKKFFVVDPTQVARIRERESVLTAIRTKNTAALASLGVEFGADIIIVGEAFSELAGRQGNLISTRARVEARAIQTDNARILATDGKFGSGLDIAEFVSAKAALRNAGTEWANYFLSQICQVSDANEAAGTFATIPAGNSAPLAGSSLPIEIMISNIDYNQMKQFSDRLAKIPGVKSVEKKLTGNVARISVDYNGNAEKLADAVSVTKFGLMKVNIVGLSGNKIEISIGK